MALPGAVVHIRKMRCSIMCSLAKDIGIDLGTASVLVYVKGKGVVLNEPSVVAINKDDGRLLSVGADAQAMLGRTPGNIVAIRPLREGVISDYDMTERMLKEFIRKVSGSFHHIFKPRVIICVPSGITEVEERAVVDAGLQSGASHVYLIEEPVAAAIGAGIDITKPEGHMVVDIGGGTSDIAVISLKGVVESASIKVAGDQFNEAIVKYMRRKHNILIGERTAEQMKMQIGCVFPKEEETTIEIKGRCLMTGLPKTITVTSTEMLEAFEEPVERILEAIHGVLERTPPELVADIANNGIVMTGGGSLVDGFDKLITARTGIHTVVAENAISCVAIGTGKSLDSLGKSEEELLKEVRPQAEEITRMQVLLLAIAKKEGLEVSEQEVNAQLYQLCMRSGEDFKQVREAYEKSGMIFTLRDRILADKAMDAVYAKAQVKEVEPKPAEKTEENN